MKKFNLFELLILVLFLLAFFASACKKELSIENKTSIENAKEWYLKLTANSRTTFKASDDMTESIVTQFDWNNAKIYDFSDGKEVIGTPIIIKKANNKTVSGSFMLLVYKTDNQYHSQIIYNEKDNYYSKTAMNSDIEASFIVGQNNNALRSLAKSKKMRSNSSDGRLMNMPIDETLCIDWYWIETITWPDGYVSVDETYLYTTCSSPGHSGSGGSDNSVSLSFVVVDSLVSPCMEAAFSKFSDTKINSYITNLYDKLYVGTNSSINLKIKEAANLSTQNSGNVPAYSTFNVNNNTWEITLSNNFFSGNTYKMSQEAWAQIIVHELLHGFIAKEEPNINHAELDHAYIFRSYVDATKDFLMGAYGMTAGDALGLSLNGIRDLWAYPDFEALSVSKYGLNNTQVNATFDKYTKESGGTKCN